ncbi:MAG: TlpA family protein disulfide reductase [bacterium]|nr:TlpA family protein disulfide reductase [bacterium]
MKLLSATGALLTLATPSTFLPAQASPEIEQICTVTWSKWIALVKKSRGAESGMPLAQVEALLAPVPWGKLDGKQLGKLANPAARTMVARSAAYSRAVELCRHQTVDAIHAYDARLLLCSAADDKQFELIQREQGEDSANRFLLNHTAGRQAILEAALCHPALPEALASGVGVRILREASLGLMTDDMLALFSDQLLAAGKDICRTETFQQARFVIAYTASLEMIEEHLEPGLVADWRKQAASYLARVTRNTASPARAAHLDRVIKEYRSKPGRGRALTATAPELQFLWRSDEQVPARLSDLKGQVVVLDFWTTWCGSCIHAFPKLRELKQRFGDKVVLLGVTSAQGFHVKADGTKVDCEGDPQAEFALMRESIKNHDITWPIVFTRRPIFGPRYSVRGIPHLAVIDKKGQLRFNRSGSKEAFAELMGMLAELTK